MTQILRTPRVTRRTFSIGLLAVVPACGAPTWEAEPVHPSDLPVPPEFEPSLVETPGLAARELHVYPDDFSLLWTHPGGQATRYTVGIGRPGRYFSGSFYVGDKREWPAWTPTAAMLRSEPDLYGPYAGGMPGGPDNPLGARALYLYRANGSDSLLRIHGTNDVRGLGHEISNGCVRMANTHVTELYADVAIGTRVVLHRRSGRGQDQA